MKQYAFYESDIFATAKDRVNAFCFSILVIQVVVKSQVLAGGRGLGTFKNGFQGGVHIVKADQAEEIASTENSPLLDFSKILILCYWTELC